ncbi:hypothetical protein B0H10DRAFT_2213699 [Mycena sp. CBHHK59/15]|nr:hypothetical protein B0H10DRAFT_2213699 [Mycena sp. CBHHK59/15]
MFLLPISQMTNRATFTDLKNLQSNRDRPRNFYPVPETWSSMELKVQYLPRLFTGPGDKNELSDNDGSFTLTSPVPPTTLYQLSNGILYDLQNGSRDMTDRHVEDARSTSTSTTEVAPALADESNHFGSIAQVARSASTLSSISESVNSIVVDSNTTAVALAVVPDRAQVAITTIPAMGPVAAAVTVVPVSVAPAPQVESPLAAPPVAATLLTERVSDAEASRQLLGTNRDPPTMPLLPSANVSNGQHVEAAGSVPSQQSRTVSEGDTFLHRISHDEVAMVAMRARFRAEHGVTTNCLRDAKASLLVRLGRLLNFADDVHGIYAAHRMPRDASWDTDHGVDREITTTWMCERNGDPTNRVSASILPLDSSLLAASMQLRNLANPKDMRFCAAWGPGQLRGNTWMNRGPQTLGVPTTATLFVEYFNATSRLQEKSRMTRLRVQELKAHDLVLMEVTVARYAVRAGGGEPAAGSTARQIPMDNWIPYYKLEALYLLDSAARESSWT